MAIANMHLATIFAFMLFILGTQAISGRSTWYEGNYRNNACNMDVPGNYMFAAGSKTIYNNGNGCGAKYQIKCVRANNLGAGCYNHDTFTVTVIDYCNEDDGPCNAELDLPKELFQRMAPLDTGNIIIEYNSI